MSIDITNNLGIVNVSASLQNFVSVTDNSYTVTVTPIIVSEIPIVNLTINDTESDIAKKK